MRTRLSFWGQKLGQYRRKISCIEGNAKCCHLITCKWTLRQLFICLRPRTLYPPDKLYTCIQYTHNPLTHYVCVYCILNHTGRGGDFNLSRTLRGNSSQSWVRKYQHDWLYLQSIELYRSIFLDDNIFLWCLYS